MFQGVIPPLPERSSADFVATTVPFPAFLLAGRLIPRQHSFLQERQDPTHVHMAYRVFTPSIWAIRRRLVLIGQFPRAMCPGNAVLHLITGQTFHLTNAIPRLP